MHSKGTVSIFSSKYELDRIKNVKILKFLEITYPLDPLDLPGAALGIWICGCHHLIQALP